KIRVEQHFHLTGKKPGMVQSVERRIPLCIVDGFRYLLNAHDLPAAVGHKNTQAAYATIEVVEMIFRFEVGQLLGQRIKCRRLNTIRLKKRLGSDVKSDMSKRFNQRVVTVLEYGLEIVNRVILFGV